MVFPRRHFPPWTGLRASIVTVIATGLKYFQSMKKIKPNHIYLTPRMMKRCKKIAWGLMTTSVWGFACPVPRPSSQLQATLQMQPLARDAAAQQEFKAMEREWQRPPPRQEGRSTDARGRAHRHLPHLRLHEQGPVHVDSQTPADEPPSLPFRNWVSPQLSFPQLLIHGKNSRITSMEETQWNVWSTFT